MNKYQKGLVTGWVGGMLTALLIVYIIYWTYPFRHRPKTVEPVIRAQDTVQTGISLDSVLARGWPRDRIIGTRPDSAATKKEVDTEQGSLHDTVTGRVYLFSSGKLDTTGWFGPGTISSFSFIKTPDWSLDSNMKTGGYLVRWKRQPVATKCSSCSQWIVSDTNAVDTIRKTFEKLKATLAQIDSIERAEEIKEEVDTL